MVHQFLYITISVPDLEQATGEFAVLADALGLRCRQHGWDLSNTRIQLEEGMHDRAQISALGLSVESLPPPRCNLRGLNLRFAEGEAVTLPVDGIGVDHVVLQSADADDCIRLFRDDLGIRLALDQNVPEWGGRMLFFRAGKMTLEVIAHEEDRPPQDVFWGITLLCPDIEASHRSLGEAGVALSELREGRKPGTRVTTLKSHTLGIPALLIGPA